MIYTKLTTLALSISYDAHLGQVDKSGAPYFVHPLMVANAMDDEVSTCVALLHDVVEDTAISMEQLACVFPEEIIGPLRLLTHEEGVDYFDYIRALSTDPVAHKVKLADIAHNSDETRANGRKKVNPEHLERLRKKYAKAKAILAEQEHVIYAMENREDALRDRASQTDDSEGSEQ